jgi:serine/threonine-protein kinase
MRPSLGEAIMHILDRPLLLGLLALEQKFVAADDLVAAFREWRHQPDESLGSILAAQGKLTPERMHTLERLMAESSLLSYPDRRSSDDAAPTTTWRPGSTPAIAQLEPTTPHRWSPAPSSMNGSSMPEGSQARFRPIKLHAQGGLGQVFVAEDLELHREVALKEIQRENADDPSSRRRFVAEAEITGNLEHPGIVPVYGLGVYADGRPFYAMRFIQGQTLNAAIKDFHDKGRSDFGSLQFRQLLSRVVSVSNAVGFAHSRGIIHRDLKPQNVMLGPFGETLVVDWGLAKSLSEPGTKDAELSIDRASGMHRDGAELTSTGEIVGTPAYMSPEQAQGRTSEVGTASDVYGLGAILYVLLTGKSPRSGRIGEAMEGTPGGPIAQPRQLQPQAPRALAAICMKALASDAVDRYASALDLTADIERWLANEPTTAFAEPWTDTASRWMRKHRLPVAVAAALLVATSIALAVGNVLVRKERDIAQTERGKAVVANQQAQANAAATRQVVEQFLIQVGDDRWSEIPGFEDVRLEMVKLAVERYRQLLIQQPDDLALSADAAMAFRRCANLYRMVGQFEPAKRLYDEAMKRFAKVAAAEPAARSETRRCETLCDRADLIFRAWGPKAAEQPMREALVAIRAVRKREPGSRAARQAEARAEGDLSDVLRELGRYDEAISLAQHAAEVFQRAADAAPQSAVSRVTAAFSAASLGQVLGEAGQLDEAAAALATASRRTIGDLRSNTRDANLRYILALTDFEQAVVRERRGGPTDEAAELVSEAVAELEQLSREFSGTTSFRRQLAQGTIIQGRLALARGELERAASSAGRAVELLVALDRKSNSPAVFQPLLAAAYALAGEIELCRDDAAAAASMLAEAQDRFRRARAANPDSPRLADAADRIESLLGNSR